MLKKQNQCVLWTVTSSIHSYQRVPSMYAVTNIQEAATDTVQATWLYMQHNLEKNTADCRDLHWTLKLSRLLGSETSELYLDKRCHGLPLMQNPIWLMLQLNLDTIHAFMSLNSTGLTTNLHFNGHLKELCHRLFLNVSPYVSLISLVARRKTTRKYIFLWFDEWKTIIFRWWQIKKRSSKESTRHTFGVKTKEQRHTRAHY